MADTRGATRTDPATIRMLLRIAGGVLFMYLMGLGAQVHVPVPPYEVPMTLQTLVMVLAALCLGARTGTCAMGGYVLAGVIGAPIFAGESAGWAILMGQTGGYLLGFIVSQPVIMWCVRRRDGSIRGWLGTWLAVIAGHMVVFAVGVPWLWVVRRTVEPLSVWDALYGGMLVFVPWMLVKSILGVLIGRAIMPWAQRNVW